MSMFGFKEMQDIQRQLQERYFARWGGLSPQKGKDTLLWMIVEIGEAADILSKEGVEAIVSDPQIRRHFVEELCDTLMYWNDLALCYELDPVELACVYVEKHQRNLTRWKQDPLPPQSPSPDALQESARSGRFSMEDMRQIQLQLRARYLDFWGPLDPSQAILTIMRLMIEAGEVADILKKQHPQAVMDSPDIRQHFAEEMCDVMMYVHDLMLCYSVTPDELEQVYLEKHRTNMNRWPTE